MVYTQLANQFVTQFLRTVLAIACLSLSVSTYAASASGEDDTILVEVAPSKTKFSYSSAFKAFSKRVLKFDVDEFFSGGKDCRDAIMRNFSDLSDRTRYKVNLNHDRVEFKLTVNL